MMKIRRLLCIVLCCIILGGCGSSVEPATEPTADLAAPFLEMAQSFVDQQDYDGAIAVLEQALETLDDTRLSTLLAEVRDLRSTPLEVEYSFNSSTMEEDVVVIHSITAEQLYTSEVVYSVTYTAPGGWIPQLWGRNLFHAFTEGTAGGKEVITFGIAEKDVRNLSGQFQLAFTIPELHQVVFDVKIWWPGEAKESEQESAEVQPLSSFELAYWFMDVYENAGFRVNSYRVVDDGQNCHFTLEYTAEKALKAGGYIGTMQNEEFLWENEIQTGDHTLEYSVSNEKISQNTYLTLLLTGEAGEEVNVSIDLPLRMLYTFGNPVNEPVNLGYTLYEPWQSNDYQIHSLTAVTLDNGYIRYALDMTLPKKAYFTASSYDRQNEDNTIYTTTTNAGRQMFYVDILEEELLDTMEVSVFICEVASRYENIIYIPSSWITAMTEGKPVSNPTQLQWQAEGREDYKAKSFTVEPLDNGYFRFTMRFSAPAGQNCSVFDPPNGNNVKLTWILSANKTEHTISFDLSKQTLEAVTSLTMYVDTFDKMLVTMKNIPKAVGSTAAPVEVNEISWETEGAE